jgi:hypothetical protein
MPPLLPQVISQVRFSDLEVPTDAQVLLATLRLERKQRTQPAHVPSTYAHDVASIAGERRVALEAWLAAAVWELGAAEAWPPGRQGAYRPWCCVAAVNTKSSTGLVREHA